MVKDEIEWDLVADIYNENLVMGMAKRLRKLLKLKMFFSVFRKTEKWGKY